MDEMSAGLIFIKIIPQKIFYCAAMRRTPNEHT